MANSDIEVAVIGGGAAGIAAARRLGEARVRALLIEARPRLGGRAWSMIEPASGTALDLGCGWLHSADRNPWATVAQQQQATIDKTQPPWARPSLEIGFPLDEQHAFHEAQHALWQRIDAAEAATDRPASELLEPGGRWNGLLNAVTTYISGTELEHVSAIDLARYDDTGVNWRVVEGYGALMAACGARLTIALGCPVQRIDHSGARLRIETRHGAITADQAIIALPSAILADTPDLFAPVLPDKVDAAAGLPLGLADKLFLALEHPEEFEAETRLVGRIDRAGTATYHLRPFGRPQIEAYFGGTLAHEIEAADAAGFFDFAVSELVGLIGADFARRVKPIAIHRWGGDPWARGSYSYARPGKADCREALATPVDGRLFFAGEACSLHDFSTAHGAYLTGIAAAEQVLAVRNSIVKMN
jgi:monoamine oxidase